MASAWRTAVAFFGNLLCTINSSGVSTIDSTTIAVILALLASLLTPCALASANNTKANSPPCAISIARCKASSWLLFANRATA